jgi:hypothetical protein
VAATAETGSGRAGERASQRLEELRERRRDAIRRTFLQLHSLALGCALGVTAGVGVGLSTLLLWWRGGPRVGENLKVLSSYFPGFSVDLVGAGVGAVYGFAAGCLGGFAVAAFRNAALRVVLRWLQSRAERWRRRHLLDEV